MSWVQALSDWVLANAGAWWTYVVTTVLCWVDGFFPPLPSESIVIAMATMAMHGQGKVNLWLLAPLTMLGAWLGDNTAYWIGRLVPLHKLFRGERGRRMLRKADDLLSRKAAEVLLTARFIPLYRVAINATAGTLRFPWRRFALIDLASAGSWTAFAVAIGSFAGSLFEGRPLLGIVVGVLLGLVLGWLIDRVGTWLRSRRAPAPTEDEPGATLG